jgi:SAM-dependent methyltransferase
MIKDSFGSQWWRKIRQEKHLQSDSSYLAHIRSLRIIYERYGAAQRNLNNAQSLDLGPGTSLRNPFACQGVRGVDMVENPSLGIVAADLVIEPIPFADNIFDYVTAYDFIEHIPRLIYQPARRMPFVELMNEIWRVLKPGGIFFSHTPIYPYASAFRDPTHVNILTVETFPLYFDDTYRWASIYGFKGSFKILHQTIKRPHLITLLEKSP